MNESACFSDLSLYELDRFQWLEANQGNIQGFTTERGKVLAEHAGSMESLKAHQIIPGYINALLLNNDNRQSLGQSLSTYKLTTSWITGQVIEEARSYVMSLFNVILNEVKVYTIDETVMPATSHGVVYSNGTRKHVIAAPRMSFDPYGVMVRQFAIAAHYTLMRGKPGLAAMMSDDLTQAMVGQYAMLRFAADEPEKCSVMRHLHLLVGWEFAKGLSRTPEFPLGFITSDLGEQLMHAYGTGMFKALVTEQYESASNGQAMWFGSCNFTGTAMALSFLGDDYGMARFMEIDTGDRKLADKLMEAFPGLGMNDFEAMQEGFNARLSSIIRSVSESEPVASAV
ncbi:hypothetical protein [Pseudomonas sp. P108]|uniref:hypothetical protein n=1 Tax=Pseudomonas sp. P108 TaxID=1837993 RepID=UPI0029350700|nr:hypothetical protein [Pseudomonas sp. P108]WNZ87521.1 hypothetical protein QOM10_30005 [Pseudomonas sp. P108]